ncbi:hypothetical protein GPJ56_006805 [Histomonas meleagridis]|uniref:uncharacterized protein n=1 Tax=Histomonas meleagridis TaxID=135588 RepID=UPI0035595E09|nr:hypothetical protein GPJ56_006805 [Histomonas meleagridis]KAH0800214.1 hypothetical protein GO595_007326 [Histomonas meleagridis]
MSLVFQLSPDESESLKIWGENEIVKKLGNKFAYEIFCKQLQNQVIDIPTLGKSLALKLGSKTGQFTSILIKHIKHLQTKKTEETPHEEASSLDDAKTNENQNKTKESLEDIAETNEMGSFSRTIISGDNNQKTVIVSATFPVEEEAEEKEEEDEEEVVIPKINEEIQEKNEVDERLLQIEIARAQRESKIDLNAPKITFQPRPYHELFVLEVEEEKIQEKKQKIVRETESRILVDSDDYYSSESDEFIPHHHSFRSRH